MIGEDGKPRSAARPLANDIETLPEGELELDLALNAFVLPDVSVKFDFH